jgi:hypothetical protein
MPSYTQSNCKVHVCVGERLPYSNNGGDGRLAVPLHAGKDNNKVGKIGEERIKDKVLTFK